MAYVFVLDAQRQRLPPVHPGRGRFLLRKGYAAIFRRFPFTIILTEPAEQQEPSLGEGTEHVDIVEGAETTEPLRLKLDPGSKTTGLTIVHDTSGQVVFAAEIIHRGQQVKERLDQRRACRRSRRQRHTRYRPSRFLNRRRWAGWLPPSLESRIQNVLTWVARLRQCAPVGAIALELVKFDTQLLANPAISGVEYQQGTLAGYEIREYLLEKWGRKCAYCGRATVPLEVEHMTPRGRHGSNAVWNLTLACKPCNLCKGNQTAAEFGFPELEAKGKQPFRDAAAVNTTRWALFHRLQALGLPVETGTGGRTKWNRTVRGLPKTHWLDAACVGASTPHVLRVAGIQPLMITATGRHSRQMRRTNTHGFPDKAPKATSVVGGFRTGDIVRAIVPAPSVKAGMYVGRIAVRATGSCNLTTLTGTIQGIHVRYCTPLHRGDGYRYAYQSGDPGASSPDINAGVSAPRDDDAGKSA